MPDVTAVILAGGKGTRLRSVVPNIPKCLAEVNGRPFIFYILKQLAAIKVKRIIIAVNYLGEMVSLQVGTKYLGVPIYYSYDKIENGGTGHALRAALPYINTDHILVMNGDTYVDIDLSIFMDWYFMGRSVASILLVKSKKGAFINSGLCLTTVKTIDISIPPSKYYSFDRQFLTKLYGMGLYECWSDASFIDIGTPESYAKSGEFMKKIGR